MKRKIRNFFICFVLYQVSALICAWGAKYQVFFPLYAIIYFLFSIFVFLTIFQFLSVTKEMFEDAKLESSVEALNQQQRLKAAHIQTINKKHADTVSFQKMERKNLQALYDYLEENKYPDAAKYFEQMSCDFQKMRLRPCCSDSLLNAILDSKRQNALEHGISVHYSILLPQNYELISSSISCIFFNLLDNGIESCIRADCPAPFLNISTKFRDEFLTIHMENSKSPSEIFSRTTMKEDSINHGFGLSIIEETVESYDGSWEWIDHGDIFESIILLSYSEFKGGKLHG